MIAESRSIACFRDPSQTILVILQMRLYALYSLNSKILALMIISFTAASTVSALIMGKVLKSIAGSLLNCTAFQGP